MHAPIISKSISNVDFVQTAATHTTDSKHGGGCAVEFKEANKMEGKKNKLANTVASTNTQMQDTTPAVFSQQLDNLPKEILSQPRFFQLLGNRKEDTPKGWSNPDNQKFFSEIKGFAGFDTCGHGRGVDYLFLDFDHVLDDNGDFVCANAEKCFKWIIAHFKTYCELSQSRHGVHILAVPTAGKFKMHSGGRRGTVYFVEDNADIKLEIFYLSKARYCLLTGNVFHCEPKTPIAHGEPVDDVFQALLNIIAARTKKPLKSAQKTKEKQPISDSADYDLFRAKIMLDAINPAELADTDWLAVISSCKHIGIAYSAVDTWNQRDPDRYNEEENKMRWDSATDTNFDIETLHGIAKRFGYSEKDTRREWYDLHPELKQERTPAPMNDDDAEENFIGTRDKIKSCPVNLKIPDNYLFQKSGIILVVPPKREKDEAKYICAARTPIIPTKKFREPVKGTLEYEFAILDGEKWRKVEIDGSALADTRDLSKTLSKYGAQITKGETLREFFIDVLSLNPELSELNSYNQTGWTNDDCEEFAYPSSDGNAIIRRAGYDYEKIFKPRGDREEWKKKFKEITTQGGAIARAVIGFAAAAILVKPLKIHNLQLHLWGKPSIGKTPLLKFAVSIFGNPDTDLTSTFNDTPKSRLETACAFSDLPIICEELESFAEKNSENLSGDIYNFFLGRSRGALNKDGTQRAKKLFNGARLTDGEHDLVQSCANSGEFKRVLSLRAVSLLDKEFAANLHGFCTRNCGLFGEQWIKYIIEHCDEISKDYHSFFKSVKNKFSEKNDTQLSTLIISLVAYDYFKVFLGLQEKAISGEFYQNIKTLAADLPDADEISDTKRAIDSLNSYVAAHEKSFNRPSEDTDTGKPIEIGAWGTTCCGEIRDNGEVLFHPTELKRILEKELGFKSADKLISEWYDEGKLICNQGRKDHVIKIDKKTYKVYHFKAGVIASSIDSAELNYYESIGAIDS